MKKYSLLLLNGGIGQRVAAKQPKQFIKINGIPILVYSLLIADNINEIEEIVLNYPEGWLDKVKNIVSDYAIKKKIKYVPAGKSRHQSVNLMLSASDCDHIIIHEAARPLVTKQDFENLIASEHTNVSLMLPVSFTVAPVNPVTFKVVGSLERDNLRNVQLPQKFNISDLKRAHSFAEEERKEFTEDATLCAAAGFDVFFINGSDKNLKVTNKIDVKIAGFLLAGGNEDE